MRNKYTYIFLNKERIKQKFIAGEDLDDECAISNTTFKGGCSITGIVHASNDEGEYPKNIGEWFVIKQKNEEL